MSNSDSMPFTEKYRPQSIDDIQGNNTDLKQIESWAERWSPGDEPLLFVGDPGVGKTATAQALANDMEWQLVEVNASSERTKDDIQEIAGRMNSQSVQSGQQLIFLDEVDSFSSTTSLKPLISELSDPQSPVILSGNEEWEIPGSIKRQTSTFEFSLGKQSIKAKLRDIVEKENVNISKRELGQLATRGNLRAAIGDLQQYAETGEMGWDNRQTDVDNFEVVDNVLNGKRFTGDMKPSELVIWLEENLANDFRGLEAAAAYDALAKADKWLGRVHDQQNFHWWRFAGRLADQTAELRLTEPYGGYIEKGYPEHFRSSVPEPDDNTSEAALYRELKGYDSGEFGFGGDYTYFRHSVLPQLRDFPKAVRLRLAVDLGLQEGDDALEALEISHSEFSDWFSEEIEDTQSQLAQW